MKNLKIESEVKVFYDSKTGVRHENTNYWLVDADTGKKLALAYDDGAGLDTLVEIVSTYKAAGLFLAARPDETKLGE